MEVNPLWQREGSKSSKGGERIRSGRQVKRVINGREGEGSGIVQGENIGTGSTGHMGIVHGGAI